MGRSVGIASTLISGSVSRSTWAAYSRVWIDWEKFLDQVGDGWSPGDLEALLLLFISSAFEDGVSYSGVSKKVAAVCFWARLRGLVDFTKSFLVRQALKGYKRGTWRPDTRRPVSFQLLGLICGSLRSVCLSAYEEVLFRAAFTLAFFGAFRISELVARCRSVVGGLLWADVQISQDNLSCWLRRSKTDMLGKGRRIILMRLPGSELCPVRCVEELLELRPSSAAVLLVHENGSSLSRYQFLAVFRKCLVALGLAARDYSTHSFRIGAATQAHRWGLGDEVIKKLGRWESARFRGYVRPHLL